MYMEAASAKDGFTVSPSDSTPIKADALYVGGAGDVVVTTFRGNQLTFPGVPAGAVLPITCIRVMASTTATNIVGLIY